MKHSIGLVQFSSSKSSPPSEPFPLAPDNSKDLKHSTGLIQFSSSKSTPPSEPFPQVLDNSKAAKGEGRKVPLHEYTCTWSTFQVPGGCKFPNLSVDSSLLHVYTPVKSPEEGAMLKHQFLSVLASSPNWWRNLLSTGPVPSRNPEEDVKALVRAHGSRDRSLVECVTWCVNCAKEEQSPADSQERRTCPADWVCSCCSIRLCSKCLAPAFLRYHGPCVKHRAVGILPEARDAVMPLMLAQEGLTLYCVEESIYVVRVFTEVSVGSVMASA